MFKYIPRIQIQIWAKMCVNRKHAYAERQNLEFNFQTAQTNSKSHSAGRTAPC